MKSPYHVLVTPLLLLLIAVAQPQARAQLGYKPMEWNVPDADPGDAPPVLSLDEKYMFFSSSRRTDDPWRQFLPYENRYDNDIFYRMRGGDGTWSRAINLGDGVNNGFDQSDPVVAPNGSVIFYCSLSSKDTVLWVSKLVGTHFVQPRPVGGDIQRWYTARTDSIRRHSTSFMPAMLDSARRSPKYHPSIGSDSLDKLVRREYFSHAPELFDRLGMPPSFWRYTSLRSTIFPDGKKVIFAEDFGRTGRYGVAGEGGTDLWEADISEDNNEWNNIRSLGTEVNTPEDETAPFIAADGVTLFFNRGFVIYASRFNGQKWTEIQELPSPFNMDYMPSYGFKIVPSGDKAYFINGFAGASQLQDVKIPPNDTIVRPRPVMIVTGFVTDDSTGAPLLANIIVDDLTSGRQIVKVLTNPANGAFAVSLVRGRNYGITAEKVKYLTVSKTYELPLEGRFEVDTLNIHLTRIRGGARTGLGNVTFGSSDARVTSQSSLELDRIVAFMQDNPDVTLTIEGHADQLGPDDFNMRLSQRRADSVRDYLVRKGIDKARLKAIGYGETRPIVTSGPPSALRVNRRVEIVVN